MSETSDERLNTGGPQPYPDEQERDMEAALDAESDARGTSSEGDVEGADLDDGMPE